jgi:hypothetical protein
MSLSATAYLPPPNFSPRRVGIDSAIVRGWKKRQDITNIVFVTMQHHFTPAFSFSIQHGFLHFVISLQGIHSLTVRLPSLRL